jgi:asparagine synthase (glutamine-hydrolysing)
MCGIVGIFDRRGPRPIDADVLRAMNRSQAHRGPDGSGLHVGAGVGLGNRRLAIVDVASGRQPMYSHDRRVVVVYNGEIYNYGQLMSELRALGCVFRTRCDTEVIIHAWLAWGTACVTRFRGMFAFALWDDRQELLFLARDRLGIKPLHYAQMGDYLLFGSELKSLLAYPGFSREIDRCATDQYFAYGYVPEPRTIFAAARKLPPGHTLTLRRGTAAPHPDAYWDVPFAPTSPRSLESTCAELAERLAEAVRIRSTAEVPLGALLSGGLDSSSVVAMMSKISEVPVTTCSIAFDEPRFDESRFAAAVALRHRTRHRQSLVSARDLDLLDRLAGLHDEPFADASALPTYRLCELARKEVKVALSGDGGDEGFAGYQRYARQVREERVRRLLPPGLRRLLFGPLGAAWPQADRAPRIFRAKTLLQSLAADSLDGYFNYVCVVGNGLRRRLFSSRLRRELQGYDASEVLREHARRSPSQHPLALVQYLDFKTYLPGDILTKVDRASMAHGLEVRTPFLDHELVEWLSGLPAAWKLRGNEGKYLLRKAMRPYLPAAVLSRSKMGFSIPLSAWLRGPWYGPVRERLLGDALADTGFFDRGFLEELLSRHHSGRNEFGAAIWSVLVFESFHRQALQAGSGGLPARAMALDGPI